MAAAEATASFKLWKRGEKLGEGTFGEVYVAKVRRGFERAVFPASLRKIEFLASTLNDDAGMLGAAMLV